MLASHTIVNSLSKWFSSCIYLPMKAYLQYIFVEGNKQRMGADVLTAVTSEALTPLLYEQPCGQIFITRSHDIVVLRCSLCETELHTCEEFLAHILAHYAIKAEVELLKVTQSQAFEDIGVITQYCPETQCEDEKKQVQSRTSTTQKDEELLEPMVDINSLRKTPSLDILPEDTLPESITKSTLLIKSKMRKKNKKNKKGLTKTPSKKEEDCERNYQCKTCGITFSKKPSLEAHVLRHTDQRPFPCDECDKAFYTRNELKSHKRHHSGERPFICKYCGARFTTSGWRLRHERSHEMRDSNNRPYPCDQCDKAFFDVTHLRLHAVVHTGERNHVCEICSAAFLRRRNLLQHIKTHSKVRDFICNVCHKAFTVRASLQLHQRNKHRVLEAETTLST